MCVCVCVLVCGMASRWEANSSLQSPFYSFCFRFLHAASFFLVFVHAMVLSLNRCISAFTHTQEKTVSISFKIRSTCTDHWGKMEASACVTSRIAVCLRCSLLFPSVCSLLLSISARQLFCTCTSPLPGACSAQQTSKRKTRIRQKAEGSVPTSVVV